MPKKPATKPAPAKKPIKSPEDSCLDALKKRPLSLDDIAEKLQVSRGNALDWIEGLRLKGTLIHQYGGDRYAIDKVAEQSYVGGHALEFESDKDGWFRFGVLGDSHLGSKYERLDVLNELYDEFEEAGVAQVFHTGNWIEGESRFNKHDILVHGFDGQLRYLADNYPRREGISTYAVHGDDHEGWYGQAFGVDVGKRALDTMLEAGRDDWHDLGFMEAHVNLVHHKSGATATMAVVHPGGGSAYAISYTVQKLVESYEGGEKPAILLAGHYHKMEFIEVRNVWCIQTGCTQDQTPFMRKKRLSAHVGGAIVECRQDSLTGAIVRMKVDYLRYFNKGYYNGRWSHSGPVSKPPRSLNGR